MTFSVSKKSLVISIFSHFFLQLHHLIVNPILSQHNTIQCDRKRFQITWPNLSCHIDNTFGVFVFGVGNRNFRMSLGDEIGYYWWGQPSKTNLIEWVGVVKITQFLCAFIYNICKSENGDIKLMRFNTNYSLYSLMVWYLFFYINNKKLKSHNVFFKPLLFRMYFSQKLRKFSFYLLNYLLNHAVYITYSFWFVRIYLFKTKQVEIAAEKVLKLNDITDLENPSNIWKTIFCSSLN